MDAPSSNEQIGNLRRYLKTEAERLPDANLIEREEIFAECDESLDQLRKLGWPPVAEVIDLNANVIPIRTQPSPRLA